MTFEEKVQKTIDQLSKEEINRRLEVFRAKHAQYVKNAQSRQTQTEEFINVFEEALSRI